MIIILRSLLQRRSTSICCWKLFLVNLYRSGDASTHSIANALDRQCARAPPPQNLKSKKDSSMNNLWYNRPTYIFTFLVYLRYRHIFINFWRSKVFGHTPLEIPGHAPGAGPSVRWTVRPLNCPWVGCLVVKASDTF